MTNELKRHSFPVPTHLSQAAQGALRLEMPAPAYPPLSEVEAWERCIAEMERGLVAAISGDVNANADVETLDLGDFNLFHISPHADDLIGGGVILDIHGGAMIIGGGETCRLMGIEMAARLRSTTYCVDYRMPPVHPHPVPLDDCLTAYRYLLDRFAPAQIIVSGMSAGGNLAAALILRARDEALPLPAGVILMSPEVDLTESGDSFQTNLGVDNVPAR